jgi:hypothetical protein
MTIEIVDLPIKNGGSFHSFLYVYQRVIIPQNDYGLKAWYPNGTLSSSWSMDGEFPIKYDSNRF